MRVRERADSGSVSALAASPPMLPLAPVAAVKVYTGVPQRRRRAEVAVASRLEQWAPMVVRCAWLAARGVVGDVRLVKVMQLALAVQRQEAG